MSKFNAFNNKKLINFYVCAFVAIELALAILIQVIRWPNPINSISAFISIALCFLFVLSGFRKDFDYLFSILALAATVTADVFLVLFLQQNRLAGMVAFLFAQIFYAVKISLYKQKTLTRIICLAIRILFVIIGSIAAKLLLKDGCDALAIISVIYYINLLLNTIHAFICRKWFFAVGLVLFSLCDICIGLQVMASGYLPIPPDSFLFKIAFPGFDLPWVFYLPSQVIIALSVFLSRKPKNV